jgi:hypothetical protein
MITRTRSRRGITDSDDKPQKEPSPNLERILSVASKIGSPIAIGTALLFYSGGSERNRKLARWGYDVTLLGLTTSDYVLSSTNALILPIIILLFIGVGRPDDSSNTGRYSPTTQNDQRQPAVLVCSRNEVAPGISRDSGVLAKNEAEFDELAVLRADPFGWLARSLQLLHDLRLKVACKLPFVRRKYFRHRQSPLQSPPCRPSRPELLKVDNVARYGR